MDFDPHFDPISTLFDPPFNPPFNRHFDPLRSDLLLSPLYPSRIEAASGSWKAEPLPSAGKGVADFVSKKYREVCLVGTSCAQASLGILTKCQLIHP
jgi:hypothetical protein